MPKTRTVLLIAVPLAALLFFSIYLIPYLDYLNEDIERHQNFKEVEIAGSDLKIGLEYIDDPRLWLYLYNPADTEAELDRADIWLYNGDRMIGELEGLDNITIPPKSETWVDADLTLSLGLSGIMGIGSAAIDKITDQPTDIRAEITGYYHIPGTGFTYTVHETKHFPIRNDKPTCEEMIDKALNEFSYAVEVTRWMDHDGIQINDENLDHYWTENGVDVNSIYSFGFYEKGCINDPNAGATESAYATPEQKERSERLWNELDSYYDP